MKNLADHLSPPPAIHGQKWRINVRVDPEAVDRLLEIYIILTFVSNGGSPEFAPFTNKNVFSLQSEFC